jgi:3-phenylpropionate/trans-cinnamate dioxygenase ferredoxin reductase subunit
VTGPAVVVVGGGHAGSQAALSLREAGHAGPVVLVADEPWWPYRRPALSKGYLAGTESAESLLLRAPELYAARDVEVRLGCAVTAIDRGAGQVVLASGERLAFDHLVLATGTRPRALQVPGAGLAGLVRLRTRGDADRLATLLPAAGRVVVVGAGLIGLEVAAVAATRFGCEVTVVEAAERVMGRTVLAETGRHVLGHHAGLGVDVRLGVAVQEFLEGRAGRVAGVALSDGTRVEADLVLVAIGAVPCSELAEAAGLRVANGVVVDARLRTTDPRIWAVGDCAAGPSAYAEGVVRLESLQNATDQARHVATQIATGVLSDYAAVPWFWSDQGELRVQMAGLTTDADERVLVGDPGAGSFSVLAFRGGAFVGGDSVNASSDHLSMRKLLGLPPRRRGLTPEVATRAGFGLRDHARACGQPS